MQPVQRGAVRAVQQQGRQGRGHHLLQGILEPQEEGEEVRRILVKSCAETKSFDRIAMQFQSFNTITEDCQLLMK